MKTILVDAVDAFVINGEGVLKGMYDLLETYPNIKIILTGASDEQMIEFGLNDMPYPVFTLKHDPEKTDPRYFVELLKVHDMKVEDVIYFEHNPKAVKSAESIGINSYFYDDSKNDLESLKNFIDSNL